MPEKPRKKFLPSDSPKSSFRKSGGSSRYNSRDAGGKYGSKTFRPSEEGSGDDFEGTGFSKRKRGVGGSNNQGKEYSRGGPKPLYSTGKKRPSRDDNKPVFREIKHPDAKFPRGRNQDGFGSEREKHRGDSELPKPPHSSRKDDFSHGDNPRAFLKKDSNSKFSRRKNEDDESGNRNERGQQYRGDGELPTPPPRSGKKDDFSSDDKPRPFLKKGSGSKFSRGKNDDGFKSYRSQGSRDDNSRSGGDWKKPKPFLRSGKKEGFSRRDDEHPFRRQEDFNPKFSDKRSDREFPKERFKKERGNSFYKSDSKPFREERGFKPKFSGKKSLKKKESQRDAKPKINPLLSEPFRLNKYLAHAGIASRRESDELIKSGFVTVNGQVVLEMGHKVQPGDEVRFKNRLISPEKKVYILLNKPKDYITTASDERGRPTVMELVQNATELRIYPVGRLDRNTTGLLLLTNDGELAQKLTHPSFEAKKVYLASLDKALKKEDMQQIADGVKLEEGVAMVDAIEYADPKDKRKIGLELHIGWNKVVRRIFETLGYEVVQLDRVYYAGLTKDVPRGKWRNLTEKEVIMLKHFS